MCPCLGEDRERGLILGSWCMRIRTCVTTDGAVNLLARGATAVLVAVLSQGREVGLNTLKIVTRKRCALLQGSFRRWARLEAVHAGGGPRGLGIWGRGLVVMDVGQHPRREWAVVWAPCKGCGYKGRVECGIFSRTLHPTASPAACVHVQ